MIFKCKQYSRKMMDKCKKESKKSKKGSPISQSGCTSSGRAISLSICQFEQKETVKIALDFVYLFNFPRLQLTENASLGKCLEYFTTLT